MKRISFMIVSICCASIALAAEGSMERLTDKDVKKLIENVDHGRDRFEDALDGKIKHSVLRSARGEVNIGEYLDDFQEKTKNLQERYTKDYAASSEAAAVLEQATDIDDFFERQSGGWKGESEWDRLKIDLETLAGVYRTSFPLPDGAPVRRINDSEAAEAADMLAKQANQLKKEIDKDKALPKPEKENLKDEIDDLIKQAKTVKSRTSDSKPATAEVRSMMDLVARIGQSLDQLQPAPKAMAAWSTMRPSIEKLEQAFGMVPVP